MMPRKERQARRYPAKVEVTKINGQPVSDALLLDISALGARLESSAPLALRNSVEVVFVPPWAPTEANLAGVILWKKPSEASPGHYQMGIEFYQKNWEIDLQGRAGKI